VSLIHGGVSQRLWEAAWPNLPQEQIPIGSITNGVHLPTWVAHELSEVYDAYLGPQWRDEPERRESWAPISETPDSILWATHERLRESLVAHAREQHRQSVARLGLASQPHYHQPLDPRVLTIGFARRFASYKRATLLFRDLDRLAGILNHPDRPVQFIFAGKAHPRDEAGKQMIREVVEHSRRPEFRDRLVVLERYDVELARSLVQGCDVWLNTPLRPLEASGTSGMKAVANGAVHMSVLDGWWAEAYRPEHGWSIGHNATIDDPEVQDAFDAASFYDLLEHEVAPLFYERDPDGVPGYWVRWMKNSITAFAPVFNTTRMVRERPAFTTRRPDLDVPPARQPRPPGNPPLAPACSGAALLKVATSAPPPRRLAARCSSAQALAVQLEDTRGCFTVRRDRMAPSMRGRNHPSRSRAAPRTPCATTPEPSTLWSAAGSAMPFGSCRPIQNFAIRWILALCSGPEEEPSL
jgi:alpha-glucan phosphorylase-like protein